MTTFVDSLLDDRALAELNQRVLVALESNPHLPRRMLRIETHEGRVVLRGTVQSYYQKQMAQEMLRGIDGVGSIDNRLEVTWG